MPANTRIGTTKSAIWVPEPAAYADRKLHLAFPCKENCTTVLGCITNDTHNYCTNEQLAKAKFFTCCLDRGHQYLAYYYDSSHACGKEQERLFLAPVCAVASLYVLSSFRWREQTFVGNECEYYPKNVNDQQDDCQCIAQQLAPVLGSLKAKG